MAANEIVFKFRIDGDNLEVIGTSAEKASKKTDKLSNSTDKLNKSTGQSRRNMQGTANATSNSTKAFSKMSQGMDSGLVPAYAALASNVFAITAAFGALQRAAQFEQLTKGLETLGTASGTALKTISANLQEATGHALSLEEAMRATALATSAGFGADTLERLGDVAKNASIALGRDTVDSLQRLTRGAIKLEPELLDELGIMVRLDDATAEFAATLGKTANELTLAEKRQAFMNKVLEQGEKKFGALSDAVDASPYDKLAATFSELATTVLNILNVALVPLVNILSTSPMALLGVLTLFGTGVVKQMGLNMTDLAKSVAGATDELAEQAKEALQGSLSFEGRTKATRKLQQAVVEGTQTEEMFLEAIKREEIQIASLKTKIENNTGSQKKNKAALKSREAAVLSITQAQKLSTDATRQNITATALEMIQDKQYIAGLKLGITAIYQETMAKMASDAATKKLTLSLVNLRIATAGAARGAKLFGAALLQMLPVIGQIIVVLSLAYEFIMMLYSAFRSDAAKELDQKLENLKSTTAELTDGFKEQTLALSGQSTVITTTTQRYAALATSLTTFDDALQKVLKSEATDLGYSIFGDEISDSITSVISDSQDLRDELMRLQASGDIKLSARAEIKSLNLQTRGYDKAAADFKVHMQEMAKDSRIAASTFKLVSTNVKEQAQAIADLAESIKALEMPAQDFFNSLIPKTRFDQLDAQLEDLVKNAEKEGAAAGNNFTQAFVEKAGSSSMRLLNFSDAIDNDLKRVRKLQNEISDGQKKLDKMSRTNRRGRQNEGFIELQNRINEQTKESALLNEKNAEEIKKTVKERREEIATLKKQELTNKANVALIKQRTALLKLGQETEQIVLALNVENNALIDEKIRQAEADIRLQEMSKETGKENLAQIAKIKELTQQIETLNESRVSKAEIILRKAKAENVLFNERIKAEKALQDIQNRRTSEAVNEFNLLEQSFLLQEKLKNVNDPRGTQLTAQQELDARAKTEKELEKDRKSLINLEFDRKVEAAEREFEVLAQRLKISKIETDALNARIELSNKNMKVGRIAAKQESARQLRADIKRADGNAALMADAHLRNIERQKQLDNLFGGMIAIEKVDVGPYEDAIREIEAVGNAAIENIEQERLNAVAEDQLKQALLLLKTQTEEQERNLQGLQIKDGFIQKEVELRGQILEIEEKTVQLQGERISLLEETTRLQMRAANRADPTRTTGELTARDEYDLLTQKRFADEEKIAQIRKDAIDEAGGAEKMTAQDIMNMRKAMDEAGKQAGERALSLVDLQKKQAEREKNLALDKLELEKQAQEMKVKILEAEFSLLDAQIKLYNTQAKEAGLETIDFTLPDLSGLADSFESNFQLATANILTTFENRIMKINDNVAVAGERTVAEGLAGTKEGTMFERIQAANDAGIFGGTKQVETGEFDESGAPTTQSVDLTTTAEKLEALKGITEPMRQFAMDMGPEGELVSTAMTGIFAMTDAFISIGDASEEAGGRSAAVATAIGASIGAINNLMQASAKKKTAAIDREIAAEKKRDGQSKQSIEKIKQLEKKKENIARKAFEMNKKMLIAQTIANTAAGVMATMKDGFWASPLAMIVAAMGAAQVALIASQKFEGGGGSADATGGAPKQLSMGSRGSTVDLARSQSARGEAAYLRGESGTGGAENFRSAFYGAKTRAAGGEAVGYVVGEQGPELFVPETTGEIVTADDAETLGAGGANVNINITTLDSAGVEDILENQRGNIITMIRDSFNAGGETFGEFIEPAEYTPSSAGARIY